MMKKTCLKGTLIVLFLLGLFWLNGCGRCVRWEYRDVTRSECRAWSAGNCTSYRYYTVQEQFCAEREGKEGGGYKLEKATKEDKAVFLIDVVTGKEIRSFLGHTDYVYSVAFSPDGRLALSGSSDKTLRLWDVATGKEIRSFAGHTDTVWSVAFSPDGRFALSGSGDKTLRLWDVATGKEIRSFAGHTYTVRSVAFSPNGRFALSGGWDNTLRLWDVATGKEIRSFTGHLSAYFVGSCAFSSDGRVALKAGSRTWNINDATEVAKFIRTNDWK